MMSANSCPSLRQHGLVFSIFALVCILPISLFPVRAAGLDVVVLSVLIFCLGVPHGAFDVVFAQRLLRVVSLAQWTVFCLAYIALAAAVVGAWWVWPSTFLTVFLVVSAFHFSGDPDEGTSRLLRFWYAGSMLIFPAWLHQAEVAQLFGYLGVGSFGDALAGVLHTLATPWCVGLALTLAVQCRANWVTTLEVSAVAVLAIAVPPLVSFTVFFCGMHSIRHVLRTHAYANDWPWKKMLTTAVAPMLACALPVVVLLPSLDRLTLEAAVVQVLFVGLAALTVPHMLLIERVRWSGWGSAKS